MEYLSKESRDQINVIIKMISGDLKHNYFRHEAKNLAVDRQTLGGLLLLSNDYIHLFMG